MVFELVERRATGWLFRVFWRWVVESTWEAFLQTPQEPYRPTLRGTRILLPLAALSISLLVLISDSLLRGRGGADGFYRVE